MRAPDDHARAQAAVAMLASNRAEARALFGADPATTNGGEADSFPRSRTFRWLLDHRIGRWVGSAVISSVLARFPLGRFVGTWLLTGRT